jgi:hypothetical protein
VKGEHRVSEETSGYMTAPNMNGDKRLPRRDGPKGLLPSTWLNRSLRVEYAGSTGEMRETTATLLDVYPFGPVLNIAGSRTILSWDRLCLAELVEDR